MTGRAGPDHIDFEPTVSRRSVRSCSHCASASRSWPPACRAQSSGSSIRCAERRSRRGGNRTGGLAHHFARTTWSRAGRNARRRAWLPRTPRMSASLIGRFGSSTFRLSTIGVSMSLAGSRFSPESAPRPFHHGIRGRGGTIFWSALPLAGPSGHRTHLIHRPARDTIPPQGGVSSFLLSHLIL